MGLNDDTLQDEAVRFVIGVVLGALASWATVTTVQAVVGISLAVGVLAMAFGNRFMERFVASQWWR